jgi:hypothetical protein
MKAGVLFTMNTLHESEEESLDLLRAATPMVEGENFPSLPVETELIIGGVELRSPPRETVLTIEDGEPPSPPEEIVSTIEDDEPLSLRGEIVSMVAKTTQNGSTVREMNVWPIPRRNNQQKLFCPTSYHRFSPSYHPENFMMDRCFKRIVLCR